MTSTQPRRQPPQVGDEGQKSWRENRRISAQAHAAADNRRKAAEGKQARALVAEFVRAAGERGIASRPLVARSYSSNARYRTGLTGWYVRTDESLAVGEDGEYYVLRVPSELWGRVVGVRVSPQDPPLVVGVGARDGESRALRDLLGDRLERGDVQG